MRRLVEANHGTLQQLELWSSLRRPRVYFVIGSDDLVDLRAQELAKSGDIQSLMPRRKDRQIFFRESKQAHGRPQTPTVLGMQRLFEVFLQMNEGTSRLN